MEITREQVEARRAELQRGLDKLREDFARTDGAIQDCDYWLALLAAVEPDTQEQEVAA